MAPRAQVVPLELVAPRAQAAPLEQVAPRAQAAPLEPAAPPAAARRGGAGAGRQRRLRRRGRLRRRRRSERRRYRRQRGPGRCGRPGRRRWPDDQSTVRHTGAVAGRRVQRLLQHRDSELHGCECPIREPSMSAAHSATRRHGRAARPAIRAATRCSAGRATRSRHRRRPTPSAPTPDRTAPAASEAQSLPASPDGLSRQVVSASFSGSQIPRLDERPAVHAGERVRARSRLRRAAPHRFRVADAARQVLSALGHACGVGQQPIAVPSAHIRAQSPYPGLHRVPHHPGPHRAPPHRRGTSSGAPTS